MILHKLINSPERASYNSHGHPACLSAGTAPLVKDNACYELLDGGIK